VREEPKLVYNAKSFIFNFPIDCKVVLYFKKIRHPKYLVPFLVLLGLATPICLVFQGIIYLNFFAVKLKHLFKLRDVVGLS
jgi:hypothetical protein